MTWRVGVLTISDKGVRGERADESGRWLKERAALLPAEVHYQLVADEREEIADVLRRWSDEEQLACIITTGGTGLSPRDVTPEATRAVLDKEVPGLAESIRWQGLSKTPFASLSRAVAGVRGQTLIVNLPGSQGGVRDGWQALEPVLPHAMAVLQAQVGDHPAAFGYREE